MAPCNRAAEVDAHLTWMVENSGGNLSTVKGDQAENWPDSKIKAVAVAWKGEGGRWHGSHKMLGLFAFDMVILGRGNRHGG